MYLFYKTTNKVNGKFYYGVRKEFTSRNRHLDYLGSGSVLSSAINKYGKDSFERVDLMRGTESEMYELEEFVVDEDMVQRKDCYNVKVGGIGGFHQSAYDNRVRSRKGWKYPPITQEHKDAISKAKKGIKPTQETINKLIESNHKSKRVVVDGVKYSSYRQAGIALGKDWRTIKKHYGILHKSQG